MMPTGRIQGPEDRERKAILYPVRERPDQSLVERATESSEALEELCDYYIPKIYGYVLRRVGRVQDAEDITSTVFEKMLANLDSFDPGKASFSTWLYRIALNCITDHWRARGRKKESFMEDELFVAGVSDGGIERLDAYVALVELLRTLPAKYQEAVTLRYFGEMSVAEVARALDITETAASKRILRGLEDLRKRSSGSALESLL
jgi:RNA polymerase sigma-70 factor, ECF subfamily